jgi:cytidine deaminase
MNGIPEFSLTAAGVHWRHLGLVPESISVELTENFAPLLMAAREARLRAYAPYSRFHVGSALRMDGVTFTGSNIENASYGGTLCAERTAISAAAASGLRSLQLIAISTDAAHEPDIGMRAPCGLCRQVMSEFAAPELLVLLDGGTGPDGMSRGEVIPFDLLLPWRFRLGNRGQG